MKRYNTHIRSVNAAICDQLVTIGEIVLILIELRGSKCICRPKPKIYGFRRPRSTTVRCQRPCVYALSSLLHCYYSVPAHPGVTAAISPQAQLAA